MLVFSTFFILRKNYSNKQAAVTSTKFTMTDSPELNPSRSSFHAVVSESPSKLMIDFSFFLFNYHYRYFVHND